MLRLGVLNIPWAIESFNLGSVGTDSIEPYNLSNSFVSTEIQEPFNLAGFSFTESIEPFYLGVNSVVDSTEPFYLADATTGFIGTNSPSAPRLGWRDRN